MEEFYSNYYQHYVKNIFPLDINLYTNNNKFIDIRKECSNRCFFIHEVLFVSLIVAYSKYYNESKMLLSPSD